MMDSQRENNHIGGSDEIAKDGNQPKDSDSKSLQISSSSKSQNGDDVERTFDVDTFIERACSLRSEPMQLLMAEQPHSSENDSVTDSPNRKPGGKKASGTLDESVMASWLSESSSDSVWSIDQEENDKLGTYAEGESDMEEFETIPSSNGNAGCDINKTHYLPNQNAITYNLIDLDIPNEIESTSINHFGPKYSDSSDKVLRRTTNSVNKIFEESLDLLSNLSGETNLSGNSGTLFEETLNERNVYQSDDNLKNLESNAPYNYGTILKELKNDIRENSEREPGNTKTKMKINIVLERQGGNVCADSSGVFGNRLVRAFSGRIVTQPDFNSPNSEKHALHNHGPMPKELHDVEYRIKKSKSKTGALKTKMELKTIIESGEETMNMNSSDNFGKLREVTFNDLDVTQSDNNLLNTKTDKPKNLEAILNSNIEFGMNYSEKETGNIKAHCIHCDDAEHGLAEVVVVKDYPKNFSNYSKTSTCNNIKNTYVPDNAIGDSKVRSTPQTTFMAYNVTTTENPIDLLNIDENKIAKREEKLVSKKSPANSAGDKLDVEEIATCFDKNDTQQGINETSVVSNISESNQSETVIKDETLDGVVKDRPGNLIVDGFRKEINSKESEDSQIEDERTVDKVEYVEKVLLTETDMNMKNEENEKFICFGIKKLEESLEDILYAKFPPSDRESKPAIKPVIKSRTTSQKKVTFSEESAKAEGDINEIHSNESVEEEKEQESVIAQETPSDLDTALRFITESFPDHQEEDTLSDLLPIDGDSVLIPKMENAPEIMEEPEEESVTEELESIRNTATPAIPEASTKKGETKTKSKKIFPKLFKPFSIKRKKH